MFQFFDSDQVLYRYGLDELPYNITKRELLYFFSLSHQEKELIMKKNRPPNYCIVIGIQIGAHRFIGKPQIEAENTPPVIIKFVSNILNLGYSILPVKDSDREKTRREHAQIAREYIGLSLFTPEDHQTLINYLMQQSPDPGHIPDWVKTAEDFLRTKGFVLPTVKVLRRLILSARHKSIENVMIHINSQMSEQCKSLLDIILETQCKAMLFWNLILDKNVYSATPTKLSDVLERIKGMRELALKEIDLSNVPYVHIKHLARQGMNLSAYQLKDYSLLRRYSIMVTTLRELESELTDISIQMNDEILAGVFQRGQKRSEKYLRKYRRVIQQIISAFRMMSGAIIDETLLPKEIIETITKNIPLEKLRKLNEDAEIINVPRGSETLYFASEGYNVIHKYLPTLLETFKILSSSKNDPLLEAAKYYTKRRSEGKGGIGKDAPIDFIQESRWKRIVFDEQEKLKTKPWVLCLADKLRIAFRQGSLEIEGSRQYRSLNSDLIPWPEWKTIEIKDDNKLPFTFPADKAVNTLSGAVRDFSKQLNQWLNEENPSAKIDDKNRLHLTKLD